MSQEHQNKVNDEFGDIKDILRDSSQLQSEFRLSKEQSHDIDNYVMELHYQYVADKKKKRYFLLIPQLISDFFNKTAGMGYLRPAIAVGVIVIAVTTIYYFIFFRNTSEIATNVNDFKQEKIFEAPQPMQKDSEIAAKDEPYETSRQKKNPDLVGDSKNKTEEFIERDGAATEHFSLFRTESEDKMVNIESSGRGKPSAQILERGFDVKYDTLVASKTEGKEQTESEPLNSINLKLEKIAKPLMALSPQSDSPARDLVFDGKHYKSQWKQLTYQKKPINYRIRSVYKKGETNNFIFLKFEYDKSEKVDKLLDTFELEQTGINLDSLQRMQEY